MTGVFYEANDHVLSLKGMRDSLSGNFINDATVVVTLKNSSGATISGSWPKSMAYVAGSNGEYRVTLDATTAVDSGLQYTAEITVTTPGGQDAFWAFPIRGDTRKQ